MTISDPQTNQFETKSDPCLKGESQGRGMPVVLCHGLSATRRYVVHGSKALPRAGYRLITYDARGHGQSEPAGDGYEYERLTGDLDRVIDQQAAGEPLVLGGHSMGCHTALAWALENPDRLAALILIGPAWSGPAGQGELAGWDRLAEALEQGGPEEFARVNTEHMSAEPEVIETVHRISLDRMKLHRHPEAVAEALRQVPRSAPFGSLDQLGELRIPALVVASRDRMDPSHPHEVAGRYAGAINGAELVSEKEGESPLAWQGGRLSRVIIDFLGRAGTGDGAG